MKKRKRKLRRNVKIIFIVFLFFLLFFLSLSIYNNRDKNEKIEVKKMEEEKKEEIPKEEIPKEEEISKQQILKDKGIFSKYYDEAYEKLINMTLDEKIAQILLVRVPLKDGIDVLSQYQFGGYLLFGRDTTNISKDDFINKINAYQSVSKIPLIVGVDEEGGTVNRVSINPNLVAEPFRSPMSLFQEGGLELVDEDTKRKNDILGELGINLNLAPVVDIADSGSFIYNRTLGTDIDTLNEYIKRTINISKNSKVSYCLKHFPGYGNNSDTHIGIAIDNRSLEELESKDLIPFKTGIDNGAEAILVSHNILTSIDESSPASLSIEMHNILRDKLGFTGIIITDDLYMNAVRNYYDKPAIRALVAGNDFIIINDYLNGINEIKEAINSGELDINILDKAVLRVLSWKYYKGLIS